MQLSFEWNPIKAAANIRKHGISFEHAAEIFQDPMALTIFDNEHSIDEERWITMGQANNRVYILVVHTYQDSDNSNEIKIRIISARLANKSEIKQYQQG